MKKMILDFKEFKKLLDNHDWYYFMSDDNKVYQSGKSNEEYLVSLTKGNEQFKEEYNKRLKGIKI